MVSYDQLPFDDLEIPHHVSPISLWAPAQHSSTTEFGGMDLDVALLIDEVLRTVILCIST